MNKFLFIFFLITSITFGQSFSLGENYLDQGEYEKAKSIFKNLYEKQPRSQKYLLAYTEALKELEELEKAEEVFLNYLNTTNNYPNIDIELGRIYELQEKNELAQKSYQKAIASIYDNPNYAYAVGRTFQDYNLLDQAIVVYEKANELQPRINYKVQLARIYGEQGKLEQMFQNYIYLILESPNYFNVVSRNFNEYITENAQNEANTVFRKLLLKELQKEPNVLYNQLLSWLFMQQGDFSKAFAQEKAIYKRSQSQNFQRLIELADEAGNASQNTETSQLILNYVIEEAKDRRNQLRAVQLLMKQKVAFAKPTENLNIKADFEKYLDTYGYTPNTAELQLVYAEFLAFRLQEKEEAKQLINQLSEQAINTFTQANAKMLLADIFVLEEQFNQALVYYSQVEKLVKNTNLAQEAKFKVAKTSYFKGDFEWAVTQLDVLKNATSQLIANDAMALARNIKDNSYQDSIQTALQKIAKADLLTFQEESENAIVLLNEILNEFKGEPIEDEALYRKANLLSKLGNFQAAADAYEQIIENFPFDILADDALFALSKLYENQLALPEKAKTQYEKIIFEHPDSIYFVDAQKAFRKLRGDAIN
ncbi:tetratricopeptide repeat protein [Psychroflexus salis]|uniref:tetratricopeptide repeat protein n=1 Tax=Psychroflexus salis TaxID=1526574 RepID=UPI0016694567|nr:tetratricopeptide repeat protein [Psychroflexus salis]